MWYPPPDFIEKLCLNGFQLFTLAPTDPRNSSIFLRELRRILEFLDYPQIQWSAITSLFTRAGVPKTLCYNTSTFTLKGYIHKVPKQRQLDMNLTLNSGNRRLGVTINILNELIPCLQLNHDSISNCLVILSVLSVDYRSGIYIHQLFDAMSAIAEKINESDWVAIAGEWSRKVFDIFGDMAISRQSLQFLDGCKNTKNERLIRWAQANTLELLISLESKKNNIIDIFNPVDLQKVENIVNSSQYFTILMKKPYWQLDCCVTK
jgi:hypothetical protein